MESLPNSANAEVPAVDVMVNASPDNVTVTSGTTLPSGKTYLPTKSSSGGFGAGSWAFITSIKKEARIDSVIFFITGVLKFKRKLGLFF
jgi:hypothetical protein